MNHTFTGWRKSSRSDMNGSCVEVAAIWRKSTYSGGSGNCVEVATGDWRKSSHSDGNGGCVEVTADNPVVGVRDTQQHGKGTVLEFSGAAWVTFLGEVKGERLSR